MPGTEKVGNFSPDRGDYRDVAFAQRGPIPGCLRPVVVVVAGLMTFSVLSACGPGRPGLPPRSLGAVLDQPDPASDVALVDQAGRHVTLGSFRGMVVVLAQFLTLCQDECPLTTATFQILQRSVAAAGLAKRVMFAEATVDPERDTVARLHAYQTSFGANWELLTGSQANIATLWKRFGIFYQKVPGDDPPGKDWWTGKALTYDVDHTNGFILIDSLGHERFLTQALPYLHGQIPANLRRLLNGLGIQHLQRGIDGGNYTIPQALDALSWLIGKPIRLVTS